VVQNNDERDRPAGQPSDEGGRPQRPGPRQRIGDHGGGQVEERALVAGVRAMQPPHMPAHIEVGVVDPNRAAAPQRHPDQALPQPGDRAHPFGQQPPRTGHVERRPGVEDQDRGELFRHGPGVDREHREIGRAGPLDDPGPFGDRRYAIHGSSRRWPSGCAPGPKVPGPSG
jgi:hypothetical protein